MSVAWDSKLKSLLLTEGVKTDGIKATEASLSGSPAQESGAFNLGTPSARAYSSEPEPTVENAGIRTGEIVGYRVWILGKDGLLHSVYMRRHIWMPGKVVKADTKIRIGWGPGIHAFNNPNKAWEEYSKAMYGEGGMVFGEVDLWGEVIEYEGGWKAEYAAIRRLTGIAQTNWRGQKLKRLRKLYTPNETYDDDQF